MPTWLTLVTGFLKLIGLADKAADMIADWNSRQIGRQLQQGDDLKEANAAQQREAQAATQAPTSRTELEDRLGKGDA